MTKDEAYEVAALFDEDDIIVSVTSEPAYSKGYMTGLRYYDVELIPWYNVPLGDLAKQFEKVPDGYVVTLGTRGLDTCVFIRSENRNASREF
jgi:hypothetical protein